MANKFGRLRQSSRLSDAYTNFKTWQDRPYNPQPGTRGRMKSRMPVYLHPFGITFEANEVYRSKADPDTFDTLVAYMTGTGGSVSKTKQNTEKLITRPGFRAARVVIFKNTSYQATPKKSEITQQDYLKYSGERESIPFGQEDGLAEMITVFDQIRSKVFEALSSTHETLRVSLTPERMSR
ncbi:MAG: hypothetical protein AAGD25_33790 [Cyanobacteria bacterium P01_F01_bin.150]